MILRFLQFIKEELTKVNQYSSGSGRTKSVDFVYDDENPNPKSSASGIMLRNKLKNDEIESIYNLVGEEDIPEEYLRDPKALRLLLVFNNLKFLKDMQKKGELRCEYCNKGPLVVYDIYKNIESIKSFIENPKYRYNVKFNSVDGATCDHKIPKSKGGPKFDYDNLAVCCDRCNFKKADMDYDEWMKIVNNKKFKKYL